MFPFPPTAGKHSSLGNSKLSVTGLIQMAAQLILLYFDVTYQHPFCALSSVSSIVLHEKNDLAHSETGHRKRDFFCYISAVCLLHM